MREALAWMVCLTAFCLVTLLSYVFAVRHNPSPSKTPYERTHEPEQVTKSAATPLKSDRGLQIFEAQQCSSCHSMAGVGNPRSPLDGVGLRLTHEELRNWITGNGVAADRLPAGIRKRKARYSKLSEAEMKALVEYLGTAPGSALLLLTNAQQARASDAHVKPQGTIVQVRLCLDGGALSDVAETPREKLCRTAPARPPRLGRKNDDLGLSPSAEGMADKKSLTEDQV